MNIWDILLLAAIGTALFLAVRALIRRKSCGCTGCESCNRCAHCRKNERKQKPKSQKSKKGSTLSACFPFFCTTKRLYTYCVVPPVILHIFHRVFPK